MQLSNERIAYLLKCYTERIATGAELEELTQWLADEENENPFREHVQQLMDRYDLDNVEHIEWDKVWNQIQERTYIGQPDSPIQLSKRQRLSWLKYVAAAVLIIGTSFYFWRAKTSITIPSELVNIEPANIQPGGNKALLQLADGTIITLDSAANGTLLSQNGMRIVKDKDQRVSYSNISNDPIPSSIIEKNNILITPRGGQYQLVLPDNSKVWLNAESSITFPIAFGPKERLVRVTGEVYFEIAKNETLPFRVSVGNDAAIEVLGTHFNVNAYNEQMQTTLLEGRVKLLKNQQSSSVILKPGQQAQVDQNIQIINDVDLEKVMAWKNGLFNFDGASLEEVMGQLQRWYDVEVRYVGAAPKREFRGELSRSLDWSEMLQVLKKMKVRFDIKGKNMTIYGNTINHP